MKLNIIPIIFIISILILTCNKNPTPPEEFDPTQNPYKLTIGEYPDWCPAGDSIAYVRDGDLWIFDIPGKRKWKVTENATQPSFSPGGKQIAFERDKKIYTISLDTKQERYLADGITPSWSETANGLLLRIKLLHILEAMVPLFTEYLHQTVVFIIMILT